MFCYSTSLSFDVERCRISDAGLNEASVWFHLIFPLFSIITVVDNFLTGFLFHGSIYL